MSNRSSHANKLKHLVTSKLAIPQGKLLKARLQSLAMLDAVLMPEWENRLFSFNPHWAAGEMMASMRDGQGSEFFFLFSPLGVVGKIYCPSAESELDGILIQIPSEFMSFSSETAFNFQQITCCLWQGLGEDCWTVIPSQIGRIPLLAFVGDDGRYYREFAEQYYERPISAADVTALFEHRPLTRESLLALGTGVDVGKAAADAAEIGYPIAPQLLTLSKRS